MASTTAEFLDRWPSRNYLPMEEVERLTLELASSDPNESERALYPDNTVRNFAFEPEIERYGGADLLEESLAFFNVSSLRSLDLIRSIKSEGRPKALGRAGRLLLQQAWAFARNGSELASFVEYASSMWGRELEGCKRNGDEVFERNREKFVVTFRRELERLAVLQRASEGESQICMAIEAGRRLSAKVRIAKVPTPFQILVSHMHMTANRLGLMNPEEMYLSQILGRTLRSIAECDPEFWHRVDETLDSQGTDVRNLETVKNCLPPLLEAFAR